MSSKKNNWWKPKSLKDSERHFIDENDLDKLDVGNDFGSYKVMLATNDLEKSLIRSHNDITPSFHVKAIKRILGDFNPQKIYDIGCGLGYTAKEISKEYPCAEVFGVDISVDAIDFAKKNFPNCQFFAEAVDPENKDQFFRADLIFAFGFYPFTRTSSLDDHQQYIAHLTNELSERGKLVIFQRWDVPESLSANFKEIVNSFPDLKFELYTMPIKTIGKFVRSTFLANIVSEIARPILRTFTSLEFGKNKALVISKD